MKILLVDDSKSARYALRLQLQRHGVEVETADSAESAFEILKTLLPDAILMDHMMPGLNGFEALEVIREDPRTAAIPIVMCTSHEEPEFVATANKKGVFGILPKSAAAELLPGILDKLRDKLASGVTPQPVVETIERAAQPASAPTPELSEEAIAKLVDARLEARLARLLTPMLEDLRRDLTESLLSEARHIVEDRLATEQATRRTAPPAPTMADFQAISTRLATETLPDLLKREIEAERARIMESVEKQLRAFQPKPAGGDQPAHEQLHAIEESVALKAATLARREAKEAVDAALMSAQQSNQALEQSLGSAIGRLYGLIAGAAILGIGAAAAVYFLLSA
ncbi:response regulator [Thiocystis minor]|uniref:response regulator n=1 Tax=Thiocystis minor TaxID=61597 RepID=UPI0019118B74|nr:response regulator [Thiocystis minor]MBK5963301.1 response regulator [Thiocystis minor]